MLQQEFLALAFWQSQTHEVPQS